MQFPVVSVVIPTRNRAAFLLTSVRSALAQQGVDLEVLVVDDASENAMGEVLAGFDDPRLRVIRLKERVGVARARNIGIEEARGQWLGFLDDDDIWAPNKLRLQLAAAADAHASFVCGSAVHIDVEARVMGTRPAPDPRTLARDVLSFNPVPGGASNTLAMSAHVREAGGFDERFAVLADWDCWIRLARSARAAACEEVVVAYRGHAAAMSASREYRKLDELSLIEAKYREERAAEGVQLARRRTLQWMAGYERLGGNRVRAAETYLTLARVERSPVDVLRAGGALLGERWLRVGARLRDLARSRGDRATVPRAAEAPTWLAAYAGAPEPVMKTELQPPT
jgi:glycosyltransferase involved in cell wall biosynthesis